MPIITYGLGGFDESKPNNNIIEIIEDFVEEIINSDVIEEIEN